MPATPPKPPAQQQPTPNWHRHSGAAAAHPAAGTAAASEGAPEMIKDVVELANEVRFAQRLFERQARMYRRAQTVGTFLTVLGGSALMTALSSQVPAALSWAGATLMALCGAALVAVRPADKAALAEAAARKYLALDVQPPAQALSQRLGAARASDPPVVEPLRWVAYNDVLLEIGRSDCLVPLRPAQRLLAALA